MSWLLTAVGLVSQSTPEQAAPPTKRTPKRNENARRFARKPSIEKASIEEGSATFTKIAHGATTGGAAAPAPESKTRKAHFGPSST